MKILSTLTLIIAVSAYAHSGIAYLFLHQPWHFTAWVATWTMLLSI